MIILNRSHTISPSHFTRHTEASSKLLLARRYFPAGTPTKALPNLHPTFLGELQKVSRKQNFLLLTIFLFTDRISKLSLKTHTSQHRSQWPAQRLRCRRISSNSSPPMVNSKEDTTASHNRMWYVETFFPFLNAQHFTFAFWRIGIVVVSR